MNKSLKDHSATALLDALTERIKADARAEAVNAIMEKLGGSAPTPVKPRRVRARVAAGTAASMTPESGRILAHVKANPGQRGEQIAAALGTTTKAMRPVMKGLIAARKVKTSGQKRGMTYSANGA